MRLTFNMADFCWLVRLNLCPLAAPEGSLLTGSASLPTEPPEPTTPPKEGANAAPGLSHGPSLKTATDALPATGSSDIVQSSALMPSLVAAAAGATLAGAHCFRV